MLITRIFRTQSATLAGLNKSAAARPGNPPLYIHISGCGILADDARGEPMDHVDEYSDIGLDLKKYVSLAFNEHRSL